jgi:polyisoprenoid-binding protein YceI
MTIMNASPLKHRLIAFVLLACSLPALAQQLVPAQSEIVFVSKQMGVPVEGRFQKFNAKIVFTPSKPDQANIAFTVDMTSATLGVKETDAELPKAEWFNTAKFAQASFQSTSVKALGAGKFEVAGKLSIKGATQTVLVPVTLTQAGANTTATGAFALKRLAFKIGDNEWSDTSMVADDVQVKFKFALTGVAKL